MDRKKKGEGKTNPIEVGQGGQLFDRVQIEILGQVLQILLSSLDTPQLHFKTEDRPGHIDSVLLDILGAQWLLPGGSMLVSQDDLEHGFHGTRILQHHLHINIIVSCFQSKLTLIDIQHIDQTIGLMNTDSITNENRRFGAILDN